MNFHWAGWDKTLREVPFHPGMLVLFFLVFNIRELDNYVLPEEVVMSFAALGLLSILCFALPLLVLKQHAKAGLVASLLLVITLFYRDIYYAASDLLGGPMRHRTLLPIVYGIVAIAVVLLWRSKRGFNGVNHYLNLLFVLILGIEISRAVVAEFQGHEWEAYIDREDKEADMPEHQAAEGSPDIYFILLDAYTSSQSLQRYWDFDNSAFDNWLKQEGFHVSSNASSNYNITEYCMASMFNMDYLPDLWNEVHGSIARETIVRVKINSNELTERLAKHGYDLVNYSLFNMAGEQHYLDYDYLELHGLSLLEHLFKKTSVGKIWTDTYFSTLRPTRGKELFEQLAAESAQRSERPKFVYGHVIMPHRPFFFDSKGQLYEHGWGPYPKNPKANYLEQLQYCNTLVQETVEQIKANTNGNAVIILQGDHGYRVLSDPTTKDNEGYSCLNAMYVPDQSCSNCYDSVSGVNVFRVMLNELFNEQLPLLDDHRDMRIHKDYEESTMPGH